MVHLGIDFVEVVVMLVDSDYKDVVVAFEPEILELVESGIVRHGRVSCRDEMRWGGMRWMRNRLDPDFVPPQQVFKAGGCQSQAQGQDARRVRGCGAQPWRGRQPLAHPEFSAEGARASTRLPHLLLDRGQ